MAVDIFKENCEGVIGVGLIPTDADAYCQTDIDQPRSWNIERDSHAVDTAALHIEQAVGGFDVVAEDRGEFHCQSLSVRY